MVKSLFPQLLAIILVYFGSSFAASADTPPLSKHARTMASQLADKGLRYFSGEWAAYKSGLETPDDSGKTLQIYFENACGLDEGEFWRGLARWTSENSSTSSVDTPFRRRATTGMQDRGFVGGSQGVRPRNRDRNRGIGAASDISKGFRKKVYELARDYDKHIAREGSYLFLEDGEKLLKKPKSLNADLRQRAEWGLLVHASAQSAMKHHSRNPTDFYSTYQAATWTILDCRIGQQNRRALEEYLLENQYPIASEHDAKTELASLVLLVHSRDIELIQRLGSQAKQFGLSEDGIAYLEEAISPMLE